MNIEPEHNSSGIKGYNTENTNGIKENKNLHSQCKVVNEKKAKKKEKKKINDDEFIDKYKTTFMDVM
jgi:hypothetical protein